MATERPHDGPLAAIVAKPAGDRAIAGLKREGVYDADRRVKPYDAARLAIPVQTRPVETAVQQVVVQRDPERRVRGLTDRLRAHGWSDDALDDVPSSWAVIGSIIVARFDRCPQPEIVGEALLDLHGGAHTVLDVTEIRGAHREPAVEIIAGVGETETVHREQGTAYGLDLSAVMFAPGNAAERIRMGSVVAPGEAVFDMFAGIGYFTLPMARAGASVVAAERNPTAFAYLRENVARNRVVDLVDPHLTDCRELTPAVDRVVMGHFDAAEYLPTAIAAVRPGGIVHVHTLAPCDDRWREIETALATACSARNRHATVIGRRTVKSQSPGMDHVVVDARIG